MKIPTRRFAWLVLLVAPLVCRSAETATTANPPKSEVKEAAASAVLPSADNILEKYIAAIGGKEAVNKVSSHSLKSSFEMPAMGVKGTALIYAKAPNKVLSIMEIPGLGSIQQGYDGKTGWQKDPLTGLRELKDGELAMLKRQVDLEFQMDTKIREVYPKMTVKEKTKVGSTDAYVIEAVPKEGPSELLYFDVAGGLMVRRDYEFDSPQGKMKVETFMEDYRVVDGLKMPFTVRQQTAAFTILTKVEEVKQNVTIEDSKFEKPKAQ